MQDVKHAIDNLSARANEANLRGRTTRPVSECAIENAAQVIREVCRHKQRCLTGSNVQGCGAEADRVQYRCRGVGTLASVLLLPP